MRPSAGSTLSIEKKLPVTYTPYTVSGAASSRVTVRRAGDAPITSEKTGARDYNWDTQRGWKVMNPDKLNRHGTPVAYKLVPGAAFPAMMDPATPQYLRAPVIGHTLWVTRHDDDQRWPCGKYPTQSTVDTGLTEWIKDDAPLENADVVLWYVFGIHHITRPEDWPVMPADAVSFWLKPFGFFNRNPALDVPPSDRHHGS